jgi:tetratricopeptide (TPR) repeat protein
MSDPARQGSVLDLERPEPETAPGAPTPGAPVNPTQPDWKPFARSGEWRRAQAAATLSFAPAALVAALTSLNAFQEDVRARRYSAARRALDAYAGGLEETQTQSQGEAALLRTLAEPEVLRRGLAALEQGAAERDPAGLQTCLAPAEAHPLTRAEALNVLGVLHALRTEAGAARSCFEEALRVDAGHYRARMNLGNLALEAGDPQQAETEYREVLKLAPDYDGAHHNLGVALRRQGKVYESVGSIRKAQRLGVRRSQQEGREELREQFRASPKLRLVRVVLIGAVVLIAALLLFSRGG